MNFPKFNINTLKRSTSSVSFIPEIDGLRFFAIITVVLFHFNSALTKELKMSLSESFYEMGNKSEFFSLAWFWVRLDLGVKVFFAISGFVLALPFLKYYLGQSNTPVKIQPYFSRRLTRLEPPFIISLLIFSFIHLFIFKVNPLDIGKSFIAGITYMHVLLLGQANPINPVTWSLETEAQFYVIIPFLMMVLFIPRNKFFSFCILIALICFSFWFKNNFIYSKNFGASIFSYFANFISGIIFCWWYLDYNEWFKKKRPIFDFLGFISLCGLFVFYKPQATYTNQIFFNFSIVFFMFSSFKGTIFNWFFNRKFVYIIGGMCYTIYLYHYAFFHLSTKLTRFFYNESYDYTSNLIVQLFLNLFLLSIVTVPLFLWIEKPTMNKNWFKDFLKAIKNKKRAVKTNVNQKSHQS